MTLHAEHYVEQRAKAHTKRGMWLREVWLYTALVTVVVGGFVYSMSGDFRLVYPIAGLSVLVGIIGSLLAVLRSLEDNPPADGSDSIYR